MSIRFIHYLIIMYSIALFILLFFRPNEQDYDSMNLKPFATIFNYLSGQVNFLIAFYNIAANIGLFIPYGLYIDLKTKSAKYRYFFQIIIPIFVISAIEFLQYITQRGSLDIDDLILNVIGVYVGYGFAPIIKRIIQVDEK
ncbi:VanZ family protein [Bacillus sp. DNRA2]|nr:VanZ family protein [Bacillus sp. DNRA2]